MIFTLYFVYCYAMYEEKHYLILLANDYNKAECLIIFLLQFSVISNTNQSFDLTLRTSIPNKSMMIIHVLHLQDYVIKLCPYNVHAIFK